MITLFKFLRRIWREVRMARLMSIKLNLDKKVYQLQLKKEKINNKYLKIYNKEV